jgi:hypothetical protein
MLLFNTYRIPSHQGPNRWLSSAKNGFSDARSHQLVGLALACVGSAAERLVPGVPSETKAPCVRCQQALCAKDFGSTRSFLWIHVDVRPTFVVLAGIECYKVEGTKASRNLGKCGPKPVSPLK